jgi:hypothetical protein
MLMASDGQASTQVLHSVHFSLFTTAISSSSRVIASSGHSSTQVPQLTHSSLLTTAGIIDSSKFASLANPPVSISDIYLSLADLSLCQFVVPFSVFQFLAFGAVPSAHSLEISGNSADVIHIIRSAARALIFQSS